jgi:hypothetical protein
MSAYRKVVFLAAVFFSAAWAKCDLWGQEGAAQPSVLHIKLSTTTSEPGFPVFLGMYHVLDGASSPAEMRALTGTISMKNFDPTFSDSCF